MGDDNRLGDRDIDLLLRLLTAEHHRIHDLPRPKIEQDTRSSDMALCERLAEKLERIRRG